MSAPVAMRLPGFFFHPVEPAETNALPTPGDLWALHHWTWEASITLPLLALAVCYLAGSLRRGHAGILRWRHLAFWSGWASLSFCLVSPLHQLGDALFSAHMLQHEILILVASPLIAASHCSVTLLYALPQSQRRSLGRLVSRVERHPAVAAISLPLVSWVLHAVALWSWHLPYLYQASVTSDPVHALQHLSFFLTGLIFWSALYGAGRSSMSYGAATLYTFGTAVHCSALGALLTFSTVLWYPVYADRTSAWSLTAIQDQQLGGLLMWVPSGVVFIVIGVALFGRWIATSGQRIIHSSVHGSTAEERL